MSTAASRNGSLRFASLIRVSTEKQEQQGESLVTQGKANERDVAKLGGSIAECYGGQEHATPGWETAELNRLIRDAAAGRFSAVIVAYADRWSRDNAKSKQGLDVFRKHGIRFFVGTSEQDLFDPQVRLSLGVYAEVGEFIALQQAKKSIESKIERAKQGKPACGKLPFGRTYTPQAGWGIDPAKQELIQRIANRYLAGESLVNLAGEYRLAVSTLYTALLLRSGTEWLQEFSSERLNLHEAIPTTVPALLDGATIKALQEHAEANKTYRHGQAKRQYLLGRVVFCSHCGSTMSGHCHSNGRRYYQHLPASRLKNYNMAACPKQSTRVNADDLEEAVIRQLFELFGNPAAVQKAVEAATPNREQMESLRQRLGHISGELEQIGKGRDRLIRLISRGTISEDEAERELDDLKKREGSLKEELGRINTNLQHLPTAAEVKEAADKLASQFRPKESSKLWAALERANTEINRMAWGEARSLVQTVFAGKTPDGKRMGVYISGNDGSRRSPCWSYQIKGRLVDLHGTAPDLSCDEPHTTFGSSAPTESCRTLPFALSGQTGDRKGVA